MKPYYEDAKSGIVIYHGDNRKIAPLLGEFDLLLTDPPYGIGRDGMKASTSSHGGRKPYEFHGWDEAPPERWVFDMLFSLTKNQIVWGANYFPQAFPPSMGWLVWDKGQDICSSDCELAFSSFEKALRRLVLNRVSLAQDGAFHPTQKPLALFSWCLSHAPEAKTIFDPWMGSGTTLVAAKLRGLRATGIELSEEYCEIAAHRLS